MIELTAAEIAQAVSGRLRGVEHPHQLTLSHADTDSRTMRPSALFIAKPGEVTDGHRFIDDAQTAGAALVLAQRETDDPSGNPHPAVLVDDVIVAMGMLAQEIVTRIRQHSPTTVIGITGSAGKTTTKDLLAALLGPQGPTVAPQGSYNGEVGVPLTVFTADLETRYLIIEMGADAPGNIRELCSIVRPDIGAVLMVGTAHAGKFGGADKIAQTKGELAELATDHIILNADDAQVAAMADRASAPVTWFASEPGASADYGVTADEVHQRADGRLELTLVFDEPDEHGRSAFRTTSGLIGAHHVTNLLAAAAVAHRAGVAPSDIAARLDGLGPSSRWRMERTEIPWASQQDAVTILNDAYNANPESMREALRTLAIMTRENKRRGVAVLGPMLELGEDSVWLHHKIGETVVRLNIDLTLVVGDGAYALYRGAIAEGSWGSEVQWVATLDEAESWLRTALEPGDIVLFKSSNSAGLRLLGDKFATEERN
ncbi:UDP-N-acetylmuramoyl-tripeptide--D-alanyl-D-alanine ligase [Nesterenkonia haasae]|uniref:UDP-N-acetylmuramoyl-tripeptide--D-alanyl-D- alanine ligase n=1 Tax=Nesterenkonia haasae TaxID=2587813 RepID=UPI0013908A7D|nr:UDP-N-acetylmuramoyl-tripeptide--D-alanyl-D-alanine ligase [Nesterenkonia haasae]NDK32290.1 UDP-N-acetylmuramoyl-tripeptide--D-alanyl-D-alanine ligase [Nesterenkonia haasae]